MSFTYNISNESDHPVIRLQDTLTGSYAELYAFGAVLNKFCATINGDELNVIDGFASVEEAMETMTPLFKSSKLSPFVCRTKNAKFHFGDRTHHLTKYSMGNHAIHGLVFNAVFSVMETTADEESACVKLQHVYDRSDEGFPYAFRCEVEFTLRASNELQLKTTVTNIDDQLLPVADGWHPYFTLGAPVDDCLLEFQSREMLEFDDELIPTGKLIPYQEFGSLRPLGTTAFDNCFTVNFAECQPMCVFRNSQKKVQVEIHPSHEYPYLQLFTPGHRQSIAIENLSAAPDALNNGLGLKVLEPHESAYFITRYIIRSL